jgi:hypothetical protein
LTWAAGGTGAVEFAAAVALNEDHDFAPVFSLDKGGKMSHKKKYAGKRLLLRKLWRSLINIAVIIDIMMMITNDGIDFTLHSMTVLAQDMRSLFHNYLKNFFLLHFFRHSTQNRLGIPQSSSCN